MSELTIGEKLIEEYGSDYLIKMCEFLEAQPKETTAKYDGAINMLLLADTIISNDDEQYVEMARDSLIYKIYKARSKHYSFKLTPGLEIVLTCILCDRPGILVLYMTYIQYLCTKYDIHDINVYLWSNKLFPNGVLTEDSIEKSYDMQKLRPDYSIFSDNAFDYNAFVEPLMLKNDER